MSQSQPAETPPVRRAVNKSLILIATVLDVGLALQSRGQILNQEALMGSGWVTYCNRSIDRVEVEDLVGMGQKRKIEILLDYKIETF